MTYLDLGNDLDLVAVPLFKNLASTDDVVGRLHGDFNELRIGLLHEANGSLELLKLACGVSHVALDDHGTVLMELTILSAHRGVNSRCTRLRGYL